MNEAITNKDSFLYHEAEGYQSGLIGYHKPLSQAIFSKYEMVEATGTLLDPDIDRKQDWDAIQWQAYCRVVLMTFRSYVEEGYGSHSYVLYRAKSCIEHAAHDLYKLDGAVESTWDSDLLGRLQAIVEFIEEAVKILDEKGVPNSLTLRSREKNSDLRRGTFYDHLAEMIFKIIFAASAVRSPRDHCWSIQYSSVWGRFFNSSKLNSDLPAHFRPI